jgi:hypothetical protein
MKRFRGSAHDKFYIEEATITEQVFLMAEEKKCKICGTTKSKNWIERENIAGEKAYFCTKEHYEQYKAKGEESGVCEFC